MDKIIDLLLASDIFKKSSKGKDFKRMVIYTFLGLYILLSLLIIFNELFSFNIINNIKSIEGIYTNLGVLLFFLTFIALVTKGKDNNNKKESEELENIISEKNEKINTIPKLFLYFLYNFGNKYTFSEIKKIFSNVLPKYSNFGNKLDSNVLYGFKTNKEEYKSKLRENKNIPFIKENNGKLELTEEGKKYIEDNLIG